MAIALEGYFILSIYHVGMARAYPQTAYIYALLQNGRVYPQNCPNVQLELPEPNLGTSRMEPRQF